jgi:hypothetical protein
MGDQSSPSSGIDAFRDLERWLSGQTAQDAGMSELERESERRGREIVSLALSASRAWDTAPADMRRSIPSTRSCACRAACGAMSASAG